MFHVEHKGDVSRGTSSLTRCPLCHSSHSKELFEVRDWSISQENFSLLQCLSCKLVHTHPIPSDLSSYYNSPNYISHSKTKRGLINRLYHVGQVYNLRYKWSLARKSSSGTNWLDYGCGAGDFLKYIANKGIHAVGVEPHQQSREKLLRDKMTVYQPKEYFDSTAVYDCITMWHVLEHLHNPIDVLRQHHQSLSTSGTLLIAVPNHQSYDAKHYQEYWAAYDVPRHICHYDDYTMSLLAKETGFTLTTTKPLYLDALYISMLSGKYVKKNALFSLFTGLYSNFLALLNTYPFSSQIYVLRKNDHI